MDATTIITIIGAIGGMTGLVELIKYLVARKAHKRTAEAEAARAEAETDTEEWKIWRDQLDRMNEQIVIKDARIAALNEQNQQLQKELLEERNRYKEQTMRLREVQDRETVLNADNIKLTERVAELTERVAELELALKDHRCLRLTCLKRQPENEHTRKAKAEAKKKRTGKETVNPKTETP